MMRRIVALIISFSLIFQQAGFTQVAPQLGVPAYLQNLPPVVDKFRPVHLRSLSVDPATSNFNVLLDKGDAKQLQKPQIEETAKKLLEYFQIGLTLPNSMFWVNLRPDAPQDVIDPYLEKTDMGRVLLEADLQLKKDIARFTAPDTVEGRQYWDRLYRKADALYGGQDIEIPTLTRPWIVPGEIIIGESKDSAYIYKATFKVMLEQDYLKDVVFTFDDDRAKELNAYSSQIVRELIIPKLTREVNSAKRYASLRQVYYSLILAQWFKQKYKGTQGVYAGHIDARDLGGLVSKAAWSKDTYFKAYQKSFKNGEYNRQETVYTSSGETIRSYFSGGLALNALNLGNQLDQTIVQISDKIVPAIDTLVGRSPNNVKVTIDASGNPQADLASGIIQPVKPDNEPGKNQAAPVTEGETVDGGLSASVTTGVQYIRYLYAKLIGRSRESFDIFRFKNLVMSALPKKYWDALEGQITDSNGVVAHSVWVTPDLKIVTQIREIAAGNPEMLQLLEKYLFLSDRALVRATAAVLAEIIKNSSDGEYIREIFFVLCRALSKNNMYTTYDIRQQLEGALREAVIRDPGLVRLALQELNEKSGYRPGLPEALEAVLSVTPATAPGDLFIGALQRVTDKKHRAHLVRGLGYAAKYDGNILQQIADALRNDRANNRYPSARDGLLEAFVWGLTLHPLMNPGNGTAPMPKLQLEAEEFLSLVETLSKKQGLPSEQNALGFLLDAFLSKKLDLPKDDFFAHTLSRGWVRQTSIDFLSERWSKTTLLLKAMLTEFNPELLDKVDIWDIGQILNKIEPLLENKKQFLAYLLNGDLNDLILLLHAKDVATQDLSRQVFIESLLESMQQSGSVDKLEPYVEVLRGFFAGISDEAAAPALLKKVYNEMDRSGFDSANPMHLVVKYLRLQEQSAKLQLQVPGDKLSEFIKSLRNPNNYKKYEIESRIDKQEHELQIGGLVCEAIEVRQAILKAADAARKLGKDTIVFANLSYGAVALAPVIDRDSNNAYYIDGRPDIKVLHARVGSTESHNNELILLPGLLSDQQLKIVIQTRPFIVVVDGTTSVADPTRTSPHIPDGFKGYRNYMIVLTKALTGSVNPADFGVDQEHVDRLLATGEAIVLTKKIMSLKNSSAPAAFEHPYKFGFWYKRGLGILSGGSLIRSSSLYVRNGKAIASKAAKMDLEREILEDMSDASSCLFVTSTTLPSDIPREAKQILTGGRNWTPGRYDDTDEFKTYHYKPILDDQGKIVDVQLFNSYQDLARSKYLGYQTKAQPKDGGNGDQRVIMIKDYKDVIEQVRTALPGTVIFLDFDDTVVGNGGTVMPQPEYFFGTRKSMNPAISNAQLIKEAAYLEDLGIQASIDESVGNVLDVFAAARARRFPVYIITNRPEALRDSMFAVLKSLGIRQGQGNDFMDIILVDAGDGNKANKIRAYVDAATPRLQEVMFVDNLYLKALEVQEAFSDMPDFVVKAFHIDGTRQPEHSLQEYESKLTELAAAHNKTEMLLVAHGGLLQAAQNLVRAPEDPTTVASVNSLIAFIEKNGLQDVKPGYVQEYIDNIRALQAASGPVDGGYPVDIEKWKELNPQLPVDPADLKDFERFVIPKGSRFGSKYNGVTGLLSPDAGYYHPGLDFEFYKTKGSEIPVPIPERTPVHAFVSGQVIRGAGPASKTFYGNFVQVHPVTIEAVVDGKSYYLQYNHMEATVPAGQTVQAGDVIGYLVPDGPLPIHLHFQIWRNTGLGSREDMQARSIDPALVLPEAKIEFVADETINGSPDGGLDDPAIQKLIADAFNSAVELEALLEKLESGALKAFLEKTSIYKLWLNWRKNPLKIKDIIRLGVLENKPRDFYGKELRALLRTIDGSYTGRTKPIYNFSDTLHGVSYPMTAIDVVQNIVTNALKWDKEGNPVEIIVDEIDGARNLRIVISDMGPGMSVEKLKQLHLSKDVQATVSDGTFSSQYGTPAIYRNVYNVLRGSIKLTSTWYDAEKNTTVAFTRTDSVDENTGEISPSVSDTEPARPGSSTGCRYEIIIPLENSKSLKPGAVDFNRESLGKIRHDTFNQITVASGILGLLTEAAPELEPDAAKAVEACRKIQTLLEETRKQEEVVHDLRAIWENLLSSDDTLKELILRADRGDIRTVQHSLTLKVHTVEPHDVTQIKPGKEWNWEVKLEFDFAKSTMTYSGQTFAVKLQNKQYGKLANISYNAGKPGDYLYQTIPSLIAPDLGFDGTDEINRYLTLEMGFLIIYDTQTKQYRLEIDDIENGFEFYVLPNKTVVSLSTFITPNPRKPLGKYELVVAEGHFHPGGDGVMSAQDLAIMVNRAKNNHRVIPEIIATIMARSKVEMITAKADDLSDKADKELAPVIVAPNFELMKEARYLTYAYSARDYRDLPEVVAEFNKVVLEKQESSEPLFEEDMRELLEGKMNRQYIFEPLSPDGGNKDDPVKVIERTLRGTDTDFELSRGFRRTLSALKAAWQSWASDFRAQALRDLKGLMEDTKENHPAAFPEIARVLRIEAAKYVGDTHDFTDRVSTAAQELVHYIDSQSPDGGTNEQIGPILLQTGEVRVYEAVTEENRTRKEFKILGRIHSIKLDYYGAKKIIWFASHPGNGYSGVMNSELIKKLPDIPLEARKELWGAGNKTLRDILETNYVVIDDQLAIMDSAGKLFFVRIKDGNARRKIAELLGGQKSKVIYREKRERIEALQASLSNTLKEEIKKAKPGQRSLDSFDGGEATAATAAVQDIYARLFAGYKKLAAPDDWLYDDAFVLEESIVVDDTIESIAYFRGKVRINPRLAELLAADEIAFAIAHEIGHHLFLMRPLSSGPVYYRAWNLQQILDRYFAKQLGQEMSIEKMVQEHGYMSEFAADAIALQILSAAGYSLNGSLTTFRHIAQIVRSFTVEEISKIRESNQDHPKYEHPIDEDRLFRMARLMDLGLPFSSPPNEGKEIMSLMEAIADHVRDGLHPFAIGWWPINRQLAEIINAQEGVLGISAEKSGVAIAAPAQNAVDLPDKGGIDLRALPIAAKPLESLVASTGRSVPIVIDPKIIAVLNSQWAQIQQQMQQGSMPYAQMKEYVISCNKEQAAEQINQVFACIANLLRLEEEAAVATPQELKEILTTIG